MELRAEIQAKDEQLAAVERELQGSQQQLKNEMESRDDAIQEQYVCIQNLEARIEVRKHLA